MAWDGGKLAKRAWAFSHFPGKGKQGWGRVTARVDYAASPRVKFNCKAAVGGLQYYGFDRWKMGSQTSITFFDTLSNTCKGVRDLIDAHDKLLCFMAVV